MKFLQKKRLWKSLISWWRTSPLCFSSFASGLIFFRSEMPLFLLESFEMTAPRWFSDLIELLSSWIPSFLSCRADYDVHPVRGSLCWYF